MASTYRLKNKRVLIPDLGHLQNGPATIAWLLDQGARVTIIGSPVRAIEQALQRTAQDGHDYEQKKKRLTWTSKDLPADLTIAGPDDEAVLFCNFWKKKIVGITGQHGKTMAVTWANHLIGDAVAVGCGGDHSPLVALHSRARVAVVELHTQSAPNERIQIISTDSQGALRAACVAARWAGVPEKTLQRRLKSLPPVAMRQQIIHQDRALIVVNDAAATLPERGIAALERWGGPNCILIAGGTDAKADYRFWAEHVAKHIRPTNTIFLAGNATLKMRKALGVRARGIRTYESLERCWRVALDRAGKYISAVVLFSPAAKSDEPFTALVKEQFR